MAGNLFHVGAHATCPHGGSVSAVTSNTRVTVSGQPVTTVADTYTVAGCVFQVPIPSGTKPQPCVTVKILVPAARVKVNGQPVVLQTSSGLCSSAEQFPQGAPNIVATQSRVSGQ